MANLLTPVTAPAVKPYAIGGLILFLLLVAIPAGVLLPLNAYAMWKTIGLTTIIVAFLIWFIGVGPLALTFAGITGGIWNVLQKKAFGPGAAKGIETLIKALILATFVFVVEGTVATFVYFGNNTSAYIGLMVIGLASVLMGLQFEIKASMAVWVLGGLLTLFAVLSVFGVRIAIPAEHNHDTTEITSGVSMPSFSFGGGCSDERIVAQPGLVIPVSRDCPVYIDQREMAKTSFRIDVIDPKIDAGSVDGQYVQIAEAFPESQGVHDRKIMPQASMYDYAKRRGLMRDDVILFRVSAPVRGTSADALSAAIAGGTK